jgi:membrane-bound serine protease (ClpP class)
MGLLQLCRRILLIGIGCLVFGAPRPAGAQARSADVVVLRLDGAVQPAAHRYLERGLRVADKRDAVALIELDTPGGTLVSLRLMTTAITTSPVPVVVYVTPAGARAASAGFFLLIAADIAAMAPGTNTGAAHPITIGGPGREHDKEKADPAITKAVEDAAALARSLAALRGRSVSAAEAAVRDSRSYSAEEARERDLVDVVAQNRQALLEQLDGRRIRRIDGTSHVLALDDAAVMVLEKTLAERFLMVIGDPQVAYLLLLLGFLGIILELMSPGATVPGVLGGISLLLALYALSVLPVRWAGVLLMVVGVALMVAEAFATSYGLLALSGIAAFVVGSLMLIDSPLPRARISLGLVVPVAVVLAATSAFLLSRVVRTRRVPAKTGLETLVGAVGELTSPIEGGPPEGQVFVRGEYWTATAERPLPRGARVRVDRVEGFRLRVSLLAPTTA